MHGCNANPMNPHAQDSVAWLRTFILAQLYMGLVDARTAEVALAMLERLRIEAQMGKLGQAMVAPPMRPHATAKAVPLPAASKSSFMLHDHFSREGTPLREQTPADRRRRREVADWNERPVEELLAEMQQRRASRLSVAA